MHYTEIYLQSQVDYWKQKVERVRELHREDVSGYCEICPDFEYPCQTIKALEDKRD